MSEYIVDFAAHNANAAIALCDGVHEEIVRCKDCAWVSSYKRRNLVTGELSETVYNCSGHFWEPEGLNEVEPNGFCSWGEKKKGAGNDC